MGLGTMLLIVIGTVVVGLCVLVGLFELWVRSEPKSSRQQPKYFSTPRVADPQDEILYDQLNDLVAFFIAKMKEQGNPGLTTQRSRPFNPSYDMRQLEPNRKRVPIEITITDKAWWGGPHGYCSITPDGQWEYFGTYSSHREGSWDEFDAWWVVSSREFKMSIARRDPKPLNMYSVLDEQTATLGDALQVMGDMMITLLERHAPHAVSEFLTLRRPPQSPAPKRKNR